MIFALLLLCLLQNPEAVVKPVCPEVDFCWVIHNGNCLGTRFSDANHIENVAPPNCRVKQQNFGSVFDFCPCGSVNPEIAEKDWRFYATEHPLFFRGRENKKRFDSVVRNASGHDGHIHICCTVNGRSLPLVPPPIRDDAFRNVQFDGYGLRVHVGPNLRFSNFLRNSIAFFGGVESGPHKKDTHHTEPHANYCCTTHYSGPESRSPLRNQVLLLAIVGFVFAASLCYAVILEVRRKTEAAIAFWCIGVAGILFTALLGIVLVF